MNNQIDISNFDLYGRSVLERIFNKSNKDDSIVRDIAVKVGYEIIEGIFLPGDDLNSVDLAKRFGCSRTPIREALILLEKQGLVEIPPRRRPSVHEIDLKEIVDIYDVRTNLYGLVSELIISNATDEQIEKLTPIKNQMAEAASNNDLEAYFWENVAFQDTEINISGNGELKRALDSMMLRMLKLRYISLTLPGRIEQSLADHERLIRAYKERDTALAVALNRGIVQRGLAALRQSGAIDPKSE